LKYNYSNDDLQAKQVRAVKAEARSALGSIYKSSSDLSDNQKRKLSLTRNNSYFFQDNLRQVIHNNHELKSDHRLCSCGVVPVEQFMSVQGEGALKIEMPITLRRDSSGAGFGGLMSCDNPFYCPVCAPKVLIDKVNEIQNITSNFLEESEEHCSIMVTQTLSHSKDDELKPLLKDLTAANAYLKAGRFRTNLEEDFGFYSAIRAIESTHSEINGWHPHLHEIWYFKKSLTVDQVIELKERLYSKYLHKLKLMGRSASELRAIDISFVVGNGSNEKKYSTSTNMPKNTSKKINGSSSAALYVAKFDKELTMEFTKLQKLKNLSFFGILARYSETNNISDMSLILEFVTAMYRQRRINIPKQMKLYFEDDIELVDDFEEKRPVIFSFTNKEWLQVCFRKQRQSIISIANNPNYTDEMVCKFVRALIDEPQVIIPPDEYKFLNQRRVRDLTEWDWAMVS
jgi:predicted nucleotidyltransferase